MGQQLPSSSSSARRFGEPLAGFGLSLVCLKVFLHSGCSIRPLMALQSISFAQQVIDTLERTRRALERAHFIGQRCSHGSQWIKPFDNHASLQWRVPNTYTWDFPNVIKFRIAAHTNCTISEKAIRHPDYNPDRSQTLISSSMSRHLSTHNISSKFMHSFFE